MNTIFNMHEEPIVCTPEDAIRVHLVLRLDFLAAGPFLCWIEGDERKMEVQNYAPEKMYSA